MTGVKQGTWTISRLAQDAGVNVETVRYYQRIGMLKQPRKPVQGWRRYDEAALRRIRFIKRSQELGFTLAEVRELLGLRASASATTCRRVSKRAAEKIAQIDDKVRDLRAVRRVLADLAASCPEDGTGTPCPILDALDSRS